MQPMPSEDRPGAQGSDLPGGPLTQPSVPVQWAMVWVELAAATLTDQAAIARALGFGYDLGRHLLGTEHQSVEICAPDEIDVWAAELAGMVLRPDSWRAVADFAPAAAAARDGLVHALVDIARQQQSPQRLAHLLSVTSFGVRVGLLFAMAEYDAGLVEWTRRAR